MYKKFYFIVFEGIEGTGKSFQINKLSKNLKKKKLSVIKTREPGGSYTAEKIRKLIFGKSSKDFDKLTDFYLMLAARNEHIKKTILKAKKEKKIVLCDRFKDSTFAYQVVGKKINKKLNLFNEKFILKGLKPDLTIVLISNFKTIFSRINKRKYKNKFDKLDKVFFRKVQNSFIKLAKAKKNYCIFDSSINDNILEKNILKTVLKKIN